MTPPTLVFLGDEDRARGHATKALETYYAGRKAEYLEDDTIIDVRGDVIYVESTFHPNISIFTPVDDAANPGKYRLRRLGAEHRKDGMLPMGLFSVETPSDANYPNGVGLEFMYLSDGIGFCGVINAPATLVERGDQQNYILTMSILGVTEDLFQGGGTSVGTPQGFKNAITHTYAVAPMLYADSLYSICAYGVDRSGSAPKYTIVAGHQAYVDGVEKQSAYNNGGGTQYVKYYETYQALSYLTAGKGSSPDNNTYGLAVEVLENDTSYGGAGTFLPTPHPVVIPLGNMRVFILYRERVTDATKIFGGSFRLQAYLMYGAGHSWGAPSVSGVTGFLDGASHNYGTVNASYTVPPDSLRMQRLMTSLADAARTAVPLSQDETLIFGKKDRLDTAVTVKWVCYSVTSTAISEKAIVAQYHDTSDGTGRVRFDYSYRGAVHLGGQKIAAYFLKSTIPQNGSAWQEVGIVRVLSTDNGATWGNEQVCTFASSVSNDGDVVSQRPIYIGETGNSPSSSIVAVGYADRVEITANSFKMQHVKIMSSEDDGVTFVETHSSAGPLEFSAEGGVISGGGTVIVGNYFNQVNGMLALCEHGMPMDGFAPSPYKHLPAYYGTASKASRDNAADPNL